MTSGDFTLELSVNPDAVLATDTPDDMKIGAYFDGQHWTFHFFSLDEAPSALG